MTIANWITLIGIIVTIILSRLDARSNGTETKKSNKLTRQSIKEERRYNNSVVENNNKMLKQRRSEEAMLAINRFNVKIWPKFNELRNIMKYRALYHKEMKSLLNIIGLYESWEMYLITRVADSQIIRNGLKDKPKIIDIVYGIIYPKK